MPLHFVWASISNSFIGIPAIIDHDNDDFVLWESGAIIQYLVDRYDKENKLHFPSGKNLYLTQQWLSFQMSGQVSQPISLILCEPLKLHK
jgi:glutathione S-transferase